MGKRSLKGEGFQKFLQVLRGFERFSERGFQRIFRGPLRDPLRGRFPSQRLSVLLSLIMLPLELSRNTERPKSDSKVTRAATGFIMTGLTLSIFSGLTLAIVKSVSHVKSQVMFLEHLQQSFGAGSP